MNEKKGEAGDDFSAPCPIDKSNNNPQANKKGQVKIKMPRP
jgi:hypothetical protein